MNTSIAVPRDPDPCDDVAERDMMAEWLCRIRAEYLEVPGLSLTRRQAKRLWRLDDLVCDCVLQALVDSRFLRRTPTGSYVRTD